MLNVFLCDDNEVLLTRYKKILTAIAKKHDHDVRFSLFTSGESLIFNLADSPNDADIIFLDILMGKVNGIDTARQLRAAGCTAEIIFLTSSDEFVFESFDTSPLHYILKGSTG
ncbi:MAG: response regulator [Lachnospiraceae bacterium]